jgi:hypothetical protein
VRTRQNYLGVVNEESAITVNVQRLDDNSGAVEAPTTLKYRVDCQTTRTALVPWTTVTADVVTVVPVSGATNMIQDDRDAEEIKVMTVMTDEGLSTQLTSEYAWSVVNLYGAGQ